MFLVSETGLVILGIILLAIIILLAMSFKVIRQSNTGIVERLGKYIIFFTDVERGIVVDLGSFATEEKAYEELFEIVRNWEADYTNKK